MQNSNTKKTVNEKELETLNFWKENKIFEKSVDSPAGLPLGSTDIKSFSFYDGPPFATGMPHHGHILAGTIKDVMPRYKTMTGYSVRRVWGWDCHGLPIENLIEKELNLNSKKEIEELGVEKFTQACADSVLRYDVEWKKIVPRLGRWVDMDNAYKTMDTSYTESIWWAWKNLYEKNLAYEGYKIMHICPRCETPLAQSEVGLEYHDITDITVTAEFKLKNKKYNNNDLYILAWTTTPWTLPGNTALAVNKNLEYVIVENKIININPVGDSAESETSLEHTKYFIVAKKLVEKVFKNSEAYKIVEDIKIDEYIGEGYDPVFQTFNNEEYLNKLENVENIWKVWHADFITDESGTGIAHEAPAFGTEDMELAKASKIPVIKHVLMNGRFTKEVEENIPELKDLVIKKKDDSMTTDIEIVKLLAHSGKLFSKEKIVHSYPLCWRCKTPLINYATSSWFIDVPKIKEKLISENQNVSWVPAHMRDGRFGKWLEGAREWAVSRKRYWGAPLPIWKNIDGSEIFVAGSLKDLGERNKEQAKNKYFVMRHGEANSNVENRYDDGSDGSNHLTENGLGQIENLKLEIKKLNIDVIIYSPVLRTRETLEKINKYLSCEYFEENDLREFDDNDKHLYGNLKLRTQKVIEKYEEKYLEKNILIITHMATGRALFENNGVYNVNLKNAEIKNLNVYILPRGENGEVNLHRPHIDKVILKDSKGEDMKIIGDVFDCWFESGSMPFASRHYPFENKEEVDNNFQADFIAEGVDQTRGWFYSLINLGVGLFGKVPFKNVIVNGHALAKGGEKLSKSSKNYTDPMILVEKFGADAIRYALINSPMMRGEGVEFIDEMVEEVYKKNIQRLENVFDFYQMYSEGVDNLEVNNNSENILDKWILIRLQEVMNKSVEGYENYKLDIAVSEVDRFIDDFSTWYLRRSRDRLKADIGSDSENTEVEKKEKLQALNTMKYIFTEFSKTIAPVMPFLAERVYQNVTESNDSVHLQKYPTKRELEEDNKNIISEMKEVREVVAELLMIRQKNNIAVKQPLIKAVINKNINSIYFEIIKDELNIKNISVDTSLGICELDFNLTPELIREGKQRELSREIKDRRKELSLVASDFIILFIESDRYELIDEMYKKEMKIKEAHVSEDFIVQKA